MLECSSQSYAASVIALKTLTQVGRLAGDPTTVGKRLLQGRQSGFKAHLRLPIDVYAPTNHSRRTRRSSSQAPTAHQWTIGIEAQRLAGPRYQGIVPSRVVDGGVAGETCHVTWTCWFERCAKMISVARFCQSHAQDWLRRSMSRLGYSTC